MRNLFWFLVGILMAIVLAVAVGDAAAGWDKPDNPAGNQQDQSQGQMQGQSMTNSIKVDNKVSSTAVATGGNVNLTVTTPSPQPQPVTVNTPVNVQASSSPVTVEAPVNNYNIGGKAFRQFLYMDSDGFPSMPEYKGPWTGPSWNVLPLEFMPKYITPEIADQWTKGDHKCEFYPYRPRVKYLQNTFYLKDKGKPGKDGKYSLPLKEKYDIVGFTFCRATFDGTTLSMIGRTASIGMENGATTAVILGASEEFDPRNWSLGLNISGNAGLLSGTEGDRAIGGRAGLGASYGGSSTNKGQGLVFLLVDEFPDDGVKK
jgi:hypothetical protein